MVTTIPNADAEAVLNLWIGGDLYFSLHTGDPGKTGASEATGLPRQLVASADGWTDAADDASTGGRFVETVEEVSFGAASVAEVYTHMGAWSALEGGTFRGGTELEEPVDVGIGETVIVPVGDIEWVAAGL